VADWFDARHDEHLALLEGIAIARAEILARFEPDGFNIGVNVDEAAGQTVSHLHVHLIPRYCGDVADPRGGVRHVIPGRGNYLALDLNRTAYDTDTHSGAATDEHDPRISEQLGLAYVLDSPRVVGSDANPIVDHLLRDLARATAVDIAVAFVTNRGLDRLLPHLDDIVTRGGKLRFLTGDYLGVTEPDALRRLLDLEPEKGGVIELRVFECADAVGFHPKAYLIHGHHDDGAAYIGSSNLTDQGLARGVEWNYRVQPKQDLSGFRAIAAEFEELFEHRCSSPLTSEWIDRYQSKRPTPSTAIPAEVLPEITQPPEPHPIQSEALEALRRTREAGNRAGLVVLATGLGKTWLAAFDAQPFRRVLFVAHREEILAQARRTFRGIRPNATLGHYTGKSKDPGADVVFASIQTIGKSGHLARFDARAFDYVVVDEFHHADAKTYRRLIDHFEPAFLLGLTATPERTDGGDLLALCGENLVYRCDLAEGIEQQQLCPFHYFGIPDLVEYENIPWRSGRFDERALESAVATEARATNAIEQWQTHGGTRTLAFCVSQRHADFMAAFFGARGVACASVHAGPTGAPRALSLEQLQAGELAIVFSVDMFNEGVDLPAVDTVLLLRPTESRILWLQQFGRGLRLSDDKTHLAVIDYVGNHQTFLKVPMLLFPGVGDSPGEVAMALDQYEKGETELPPGCSVTYDLEAIEILKSLIRIPRGVGALQAWYEAFRHRNGVRPTALEMWHAGHDPKSVRRSYGSWVGFVVTMGDAEEKEREAQRAAESFLRALETTPMTKSYKMLVLLAMIGEETFPGSIPLEKLTEAVARRARRTAALAAELGTALDDHDALRRLLVDNPITAWADGKGTGGTAYFTYDREVFRSQIESPSDATDALRELTRELCEWRLGQYLERLRADAGHAPRFVGSVSHTNGRPLIFLPDRETNPGIPHDWTTVETAEGPLELNFVKIAVNVARRPGSNENVLPSVLRGWFGPSAGLPGEGPHRVLFQLEGGHYQLKPVGAREGQPVIGGEYPRTDIAPLWGLPFEDAKWRQSGFIWIGDQMFLLVTLEKGGMREEHRYQDRFLDAEHFQWQSQNRTPQGGKVGQALRHHRDRGIAVHLLVRRFPKTQRGKAAPFTYCGDLDFQSWEGEKPITIRWRLTKPVPEQLLRNFETAES
jgi:superfamily II DNA or RNA helicase